MSNQVVKKIKKIPTRSIYDVVKEGYSTYEKFVNDGQYIPGLDGLKKVHRRYLLSVKKIAPSRFEKSAEVLGWAIGHLHPHEIFVDALNALVRWGFVEGQGNFGLTSTYNNLPGAAMRYTEVKANKDINDILFKFEQFAPHDDGELGYPEPEFLIVPISLALLRGTLGIGVASYTKIPAFTYESLLDAYEHDDPYRLKSAYGLEILYDKSDMKSLWEDGYGKLVLKFHTEWDYDEGAAILYGDATPCKPNLSELIDLESEGAVNIIDESTNEMRIMISRAKRTRKITDDELWNIVERVSVIDGLPANYQIMFSHEGRVICTGIKHWLDMTLNMYKETVKKWKTWQLNQIDLRKDTINLIPQVVKLLQKNYSTEDIAKELKRSVNKIKVIEAKPLRYLRSLDTDAEIKKLDAKIKQVKAIKVSDLINSGKLIDSSLKVN